MGYGGKQASRSGDVRRFNFTGNGSNTAFDLGFTPATQNQLIVTINGLVQHYDAFSVTGSTLNFTGTPAAGDAIQVVAVVDAVGVAGIPDGAVANVSTLNVSGAATFDNTTTHTGAATFANTTAHTGLATFANTVYTGTATFNNTVVATSGITLGNTIQRTLTGDAVAIKVVGSYNGNTIFEVGQSSSDGVVYIRDAQGAATTLVALPTGSSTIRSRVTFPDKPVASFRHNSVGPATTVLPAISVFTSSPHLDTSTNSGRFTAPVAGRYRATITSYTNYAATYNWIGFRKNGAFQDITLHWNNGGAAQHSFVTANQIFTLAANDYLEAALHNSNGVGAGTLDYGYVTFEFLG